VPEGQRAERGSSAEVAQRSPKAYKPVGLDAQRCPEVCVDGFGAEADRRLVPDGAHADDW